MFIGQAGGEELFIRDSLYDARGSLSIITLAKFKEKNFQIFNEKKISQNIFLFIFLIFNALFWYIFHIFSY